MPPCNTCPFIVCQKRDSDNRPAACMRDPVVMPKAWRGSKSNAEEVIKGMDLQERELRRAILEGGRNDY